MTTRSGERARGDADKVRDPFRVPEHRGAAVRAEFPVAQILRTAMETASRKSAAAFRAESLAWQAFGPAFSAVHFPAASYYRGDSEVTQSSPADVDGLYHRLEPMAYGAESFRAE